MMAAPTPPTPMTTMVQSARPGERNFSSAAALAGEQPAEYRAGLPESARESAPPWPSREPTWRWRISFLLEGSPQHRRTRCSGPEPAGDSVLQAVEGSSCPARMAPRSCPDRCAVAGRPSPKERARRQSVRCNRIRPEWERKLRVVTRRQSTGIDTSQAVSPESFSRSGTSARARSR